MDAEAFFIRMHRPKLNKHKELKGVAAMWKTGVNLTYENNYLFYFFVLIIVS